MGKKPTIVDAIPVETAANFLAAAKIPNIDRLIRLGAFMIRDPDTGSVAIYKPPIKVRALTPAQIRLMNTYFDGAHSVPVETSGIPAEEFFCLSAEG